MQAILIRLGILIQKINRILEFFCQPWTIYQTFIKIFSNDQKGIIKLNDAEFINKLALSIKQQAIFLKLDNYLICLFFFALSHKNCPKNNSYIFCRKYLFQEIKKRNKKIFKKIKCINKIPVFTYTLNLIFLK